MANNLVGNIEIRENGQFEANMVTGVSVLCRKVILATGLRDVMPSIPGFSECWGRTVIHCPYCHGYEVRDQKTGIMVQGDMALEMVKLISHWTADLTPFTSGTEGLSDERKLILAKGFRIVDKRIHEVIHEQGNLSHLVMEDGTEEPLTVLYAGCL